MERYSRAAGGQVDGVQACVFNWLLQLLRSAAPCCAAFLPLLLRTLRETKVTTANFGLFFGVRDPAASALRAIPRANRGAGRVSRRADAFLWGKGPSIADGADSRAFGHLHVRVNRRRRRARGREADVLQRYVERLGVRFCVGASPLHTARERTRVRRNCGVGDGRGSIQPVTRPRAIAACHGEETLRRRQSVGGENVRSGACATRCRRRPNGAG